MRSFIYAVARGSFENAVRRAFFESLGVSDAACDCMSSNRDNGHYFELISSNDSSLSKNRNDAQRRLASPKTKCSEKTVHGLTVFCVESEEGSLCDFFQVLVDTCIKRVEEGKDYSSECRNHGGKNDYSVVYVEQSPNGLKVIAALPDGLSESLCECDYQSLRSASHHGAIGVSKYIANELSKDGRRSVQSIIAGR